MQALSAALPGEEAPAQEGSHSHSRGECKPCAYFWHKTDGCRWGAECEYCHLCDRDAMKRLKKEKRRRMKETKVRGPEDDCEDPEDHGLFVIKEADIVREIRPLPDPVRLPVRAPPGLFMAARPYLPMELLLQAHASVTAQQDAEAADAQAKLEFLKLAPLPSGLAPQQVLPSALPTQTDDSGADAQGLQEQAMFLRVEDMFPELSLMSDFHYVDTAATNVTSERLRQEAPGGAAMRPYRTPLRATANIWQP